MKRFQTLSLIAFSAVLMMGSCKPKDSDYHTDPDLLAHFTNKSNATFFVSSPSSIYKIPIGLTLPSATDTKVNVTVSSPTGAAAGVQYNLPSSSVTIPAGKLIDSISLEGLFAGFPGSRVDTLIFAITNSDVEAAPYNDTLKLVMRKFCAVSLTALSGSYTNTTEPGPPPYGPYTTTVTNLVSTGPTSASGKITNLYDDTWNAIDFTMDWSDPGNLKVSIPLQPTGKNYAGGPTSVRSSTGQVNTFSSCDRTISVTIDLVNSGTPILSNYRILMK